MHDALWSPWCDSCGLAGQLPELVQIFQKRIIKSSLLDVIFEKSRISELGTAVIHDFIKNLIDERELFFDIILSNISIKIGLANKDEMVEKLNGHGAVDIGFGGGKEDEILVRDTHVRDAIHEKNGIVTVLFGGDDLWAVVGNLGTGDVVLEATVDEDLALDVDKDNLTDHFE